MLRKIALAAASALVALALLEIGLRVTGLGVHGYLDEWRKYGSLLVLDGAGYLRHPAGTSVVNQGVAMRFNSLGMRDDEPRRPKPPDTFRVLCLGDSVTMGPGVAQEATYPARLRDLLTPDGIDVIAGAVGGWNTVSEERFLEAHAAALVPDLVVLLYVTNDNEHSEPFQPERRPAVPWTTRLYRALVLRNRLFEWGAYVYRTRVTDADTAARQGMAEWQRLREQEVRGYAANAPGWRESRTALGRIFEVTRASGGRLVVFLNNLLNGPGEREALVRLREFGAETGVPIFDTLPFFAGHPPMSLTNDGLRDPHPNARGHALLAEGVARTLRAEGLVPARRAGG